MGGGRHVTVPVVVPWIHIMIVFSVASDSFPTHLQLSKPHVYGDVKVRGTLDIEQPEDLSAVLLCIRR